MVITAPKRHPLGVDQASNGRKIKGFVDGTTNHNMTRVPIRLTPETLAQVDDRAAEMGQTRSAWIRWLIARELKQD